MNRLNTLISSKLYTFDVLDDMTEEQTEDWDELWMLVAIQISIRRPNHGQR